MLKKRIYKAISILTIISFVFCPRYGFSLPQGEQVVHGDVSFDRSQENSLKITQGTNKAIINYNSFSIGGNEAVNFLQPSASAIALNRVTGGDLSSIYGTLTANGKIFLINPNGILFGAGSRVDTAGLLASTLNITDADFLAGRYTFYGSGGSVVNQGYIGTPGGYVALLGSRVANSGIIEANLGSIALAAGEAVTLNLDPQGIISVVIDQAVSQNLEGKDEAISNTGRLTADGGKVLLSAKALDGVFKNAINTSGIIEANILDDISGEIVLEANQRVNLDGIISAQGGTLKVDSEGGDFPGYMNVSKGIFNMHDGDTYLSGIKIGDYSWWDNGNIYVVGDFLVNGNLSLEADNNNNGNGDFIQNAGTTMAVVKNVSLKGANLSLGKIYFGGDTFDAEAKSGSVNIYDAIVSQAIKLITEFIYGDRQTVSVGLVGDTYVSEQHPDTNYSDAEKLVVNSGAGNNDNWIWLKFNLSSIPDDSLLVNSGVILNRHDQASNGNTLTMYHVGLDDNWAVDEITWNNMWADLDLMNSISGPISEVVTVFKPGPSPWTTTWEITGEPGMSLLTADLLDDYTSLLIKNTAGDSVTQFKSSEAVMNVTYREKTAEEIIGYDIGDLQAGAINLKAENDVNFTDSGLVHTLGNVNIEAKNGAITDATGSMTNVYANNLVMSAKKGIASGQVLETEVKNLAARVTGQAATGNIEVSNTGDLSLTDLAGWGYAVKNSGSGGVNIEAHSDLIVDDLIWTLGGDVYLSASEGITHRVNGSVTTDGGDFVGNAGTDYIIQDGVNIIAGAGLIDIYAGENVILGAEPVNLSDNFQLIYQGGQRGFHLDGFGHDPVKGFYIIMVENSFDGNPGEVRTYYSNAHYNPDGKVHFKIEDLGAGEYLFIWEDLYNLSGLKNHLGEPDFFDVLLKYTPLKGNPMPLGTFLSSGSNIFLTADAGYVSQITGNIYSDKLMLSADKGIYGESGVKAVNTTVNNLSAINYGTGNIIVRNNGGLTIADLSALSGPNAIYGYNGINNKGAGDVIITAASPLTVNAAVSTSGDIYLEAEGSVDGNLTVNADITSTGSGTIDLIAGRNYSQKTAAVKSSEGVVNINAGRNVSVANKSDVEGKTVNITAKNGNLSINDRSRITALTSDGDAAVNILANKGNINITNNSFVTSTSLGSAVGAGNATNTILAEKGSISLSGKNASARSFVRAYSSSGWALNTISADNGNIGINYGWVNAFTHGEGSFVLSELFAPKGVISISNGIVHNWAPSGEAFNTFLAKSISSVDSIIFSNIHNGNSGNTLLATDGDISIINNSKVGCWSDSGSAVTKLDAAGNIIIEDSIIEASGSKTGASAKVELTAGEDIRASGAALIKAEGWSHDGSDVPPIGDVILSSLNTYLHNMTSIIAGRDVFADTVADFMMYDQSSIEAGRSVDISAGNEVVVSNSSITAVNNVSVKALGNIGLGAITVTNGGVFLESLKGSIYALIPGPLGFNVKAAGYSYFSAPEGTIGVLGSSEADPFSNPLTVNIDLIAGAHSALPAGFGVDDLPLSYEGIPALVLNIGGLAYPGFSGPSGTIGLSGVVAGYVNQGYTAVTGVPNAPGIDISSPKLTSLNGGPAGYVFHDNFNTSLGFLQIWPEIPVSPITADFFGADRQQYLRAYYEILQNHRVSYLQPINPTTLYFYHPLSPTDLTAFDDITLDIGAYDFIEDNLKLKNPNVLAPFYEAVSALQGNL